ncbi:MAG: AhpC/TSA family protein [Flavisolibacter sp.]|nr:AhpC/TSA family protein [Flavisolibacter sp.]
MKNLFACLLFLPTLLWAQTGNNFTITGSVAGLPEGSNVKITSLQGDNVIANGTVKSGEFTVKGEVAEPGLYWLVLGNEQPQHIYLENKAIKVSGDKKNIKNIRIEGSPLHKDFDEFRAVFNPMVGELNSVVAQINQATDEKSHAVLMTKYDSIKTRISNEVGKFVAAKPASHVSAFLLMVTAQLLDDVMLMDQRFNSLDNSVRNSSLGKAVAENIAFNKVGAVGTEALNFTQNDVNGQPVSLSSFRGKYVLVDFWASWCKPCRMENPNVVKAYHIFSNKNFTVLGVSLDQEKEPWIKAIEKDKLSWTQVSDLKFWSNEVAVLYHVQGIPQNFLVDPNGKIVAKNLRGQELEAKLCELLGCN